MANKITAGTIARTIILALALINQVFTASGHTVIPIDDETVNTLVSTAWTVVSAAVSWWYNNSFTKAARIGDAAKDAAIGGMTDESI
ncbi:MAG: phage holin [Intestinibacillus sp.]